MTNPVVDLIGDRTGRIVPIYPQSEKAQLTTWELAGLGRGRAASGAGRGASPSRCPDGSAAGSALIDRWRGAARHPPARVDRRQGAGPPAAGVRRAAARAARARHAQAGDGARRRRHPPRRRRRARAPRSTTRCRFPLTGAQRRVIAEIDADLAAPHPMHRLLQGDVGSGKTVVAVTALLAAVQGGHQGALMAPTEVLAEQHATGVRALLDGLEVPAGARQPVRRAAAARRAAHQPGHRRRAQARCSPGSPTGDVDIVIGTHALIQEGVAFHSLGVVVIDEQHRFGVEQRAALRDKAGGAVPDVLVMTATPIPRTAAMTVYGDLDVSVLDELPPGRTPIVTRWAAGALLEEEAWAAVRDEVAAGPPGLRRVPADRGVARSSRSRSAEETFERLAGGELARAAARAAARADDAGREGGRRWSASAPASSTCSWPRP